MKKITIIICFSFNVFVYCQNDKNVEFFSKFNDISLPLIIDNKMFDTLELNNNLNEILFDSLETHILYNNKVPAIKINDKANTKFYALGKVEMQYNYNTFIFLLWDKYNQEMKFFAAVYDSLKKFIDVKFIAGKMKVYNDLNTFCIIMPSMNLIVWDNPIKLGKEADNKDFSIYNCKIIYFNYKENVLSVDKVRDMY